MKLDEFRAKILPIFEAEFSRVFEQKARLSASLNSAMSYSSLNGGKRMRPLLLYATLLSFKKDFALGHKSAVALELIHCYSLIHDDLPAMDDDDLRRNQPTCHIKFNEYTAILAGDALQSLAYEILSAPNLKQEIKDAKKTLTLINILANATGGDGMVGGQMLDMQKTNEKSVNLEDVFLIHKNKTGALIKASILMGAVLAGAKEKELEILETFAEKIGLGFQIQDDILDAISTTEELGKKVAVDKDLNKASFVNLFGLQNAKIKLEEILTQAQNNLADLENIADAELDFSLLKDLALYIMRRKN